jgi:hypothetical protein
LQNLKTGDLEVECINLGRVILINGIDYGVIQREPRKTRNSTSFKVWLLVADWISNYLAPEGQVHGGRSPTYATGESTFQAFWRILMADCKAYPTERLDVSDIEHDELLFRRIRDDESVLEMLSDLKCYEMLRKMVRDRRFGTSHTGFYAMIPMDAEEGDELVAVHGAKVPLVLRHVERKDDKVFRVIGGTYVHGFMDDDARVWAEEGRLEAQPLYLA